MPITKSGSVSDPLSLTKFVSTAASGQKAFEATVAGARWHIGPTAGAYFYDLGSGGYIVTPGSLYLPTGEVQALTFRPTGTNVFNLTNYVSDGASAVGMTIATANTFSTAGSKLVSILNGATEKVYFTYDGGYRSASSSMNLGNFTAALATSPTIASGLLNKIQTGQNANIYLEGTGGIAVPALVMHMSGNTYGWSMSTPGDTSGFQFSRWGEGGTLFLQPGYPDAYIKGYAGSAGITHIQSHNGSAYKDAIVLTNDTVAVSGTSITRSVGTGTGTAQITGTLSVNTTAVGNVGTGEDDLISYTLPANSLVGTGRGIRVSASGIAANNANAKTLKFYFGSLVLTHNLPTSEALRWRFSLEVFRTGTSAQLYTSQLIHNGSSTPIDVQQGTLTETETATILIKGTGEATTNDDIVMKHLLIEAL
jgi:hypothetical protein